MNNNNSNNALVAHIVNANAKAAEWVAQADTEAGEWRCAAEYSTDPAYWAELGVFTPYDFDRSLAADSYSDFHKDCYGFRPCGYSDWTLEQLEAAIADLSRYAERMEEIWEKEAEYNRVQDLLIIAEQTGDYSAINAEYRDKYTTEQAPLGDLGALIQS
jgi:hypothetical protein